MLYWPPMRQDAPIYTFWAIIGMTLAALLIVHWLEVPGDKAMPIFIVFMLLGVPLGELLDRYSRRSKTQ